eukprot:505307-Prorocentrum_lima.AAC.1
MPSKRRGINPKSSFICGVAAMESVFCSRMPGKNSEHLVGWSRCPPACNLASIRGMAFATSVASPTT